MNDSYEGPIMGSETEFGLIPRNPPGGKYVRAREEALSAARRMCYPAEKCLRAAEIQLSNGNIPADADVSEQTGAAEKKPPSEEERLRRMGVTGERLQNGGRLYVDGYHLEYSTPECQNPFEVVAHERAGEILMRSFVDKVENTSGVRLDLMKRSSDFGAVSYACHEDYLVKRPLFGALVPSYYGRPDLSEVQLLWLLHLVSRPILIGSGLLNLRKPPKKALTLSQRTPFISRIFGVQTMENRPLINCRDRPYADWDEWGRLHVICGESNRSDWSNVLKYGSAALLLGWLADIAQCPPRKSYERLLPKMPFEKLASRIRRPETKIHLRDGGFVFPVRMQRYIYAQVAEWLQWRSAHAPELAWAPKVMEMWNDALSALENPSGISFLDDKLDWRVKQSNYDSMIAAGATMDDLKQFDYAYHVVGTDSLYEELQREGCVLSLVGDAEVQEALITPPATRARARTVIAKHFQNVLCTGWEFVVVEWKKGTYKILLPDPRNTSWKVNPSDQPMRLEDLLERGPVCG